MIETLPPIDNAMWVTGSILHQHSQGIALTLFVGIILYGAAMMRFK